MKLVRISSITLALALATALAPAQPSPITGGHVHTIAYHDRTPHVHNHTPVAHH